ncbi:MAG: hypothetical protein QM730_17670 [Anaerolineales bacterium]
MEISFQNKLSDFEAFFDYMLNHTQEGKQFGERAYYVRQVAILCLLIILSLVYWGITGKGFAAFLLFWGAFVLINGAISVVTKFKPHYYFGKKGYKDQLKLLSSRSK